MSFVAVFHPDLGPSSVAEVPEETLEHHAERGWLAVPDDVNVADPEAVAALFAPPDPQPSGSTRKPKES